MKVVVVGANGQIGQHVVKQLKSHKDHEPIATVRKQDQQAAFEAQGVTCKIVDLEDSIDSIAEGINGNDAIVFTAGSGAKTGYDKTLSIDLDGAIKTMKAAEKVGIKRYIMVSAFQANNREIFNAVEGMKPYYIAKHYADEFLLSSGLDYTIIRPGGLLNKPGTGEIEASNNNLQPGSIPREDVAKTIIATLERPNLIGKSFDLVSGKHTIDQVLDMI